jgi:hypothetical protein
MGQHHFPDCAEDLPGRQPGRARAPACPSSAVRNSMPNWSKSKASYRLRILPGISGWLWNTWTRCREPNFDGASSTRTNWSVRSYQRRCNGSYRSPVNRQTRDVFCPSLARRTGASGGRVPHETHGTAYRTGCTGKDTGRSGSRTAPSGCAAPNVGRHGFGKQDSAASGSLPVEHGRNAVFIVAPGNCTTWRRKRSVVLVRDCIPQYLTLCECRTASVECARHYSIELISGVGQSNPDRYPPSA